MDKFVGPPPGSTSLPAMLYRPCFSDELLADWVVYATGSSLDFNTLFDEILKIDEIGYVALSIDDSVDFDEDIEHVTAENFPWGAWMLLAGAARDAQGKWVIRNVKEEHDKK